MTPEQAARLKREQKARRAAGLDAPLLNARAITGEAALTGAGGAARTGRRRRSIRIAPVSGSRRPRPRAAPRSSSASPVTKVTFTARPPTCSTAGGRIHTRRVIVATGMPTALFKCSSAALLVPHAYLALTEPVPASVRQLTRPARDRRARQRRSRRT